MNLGPPDGTGWKSYGFRRSSPTSSFLSDSDRVQLRFWWHEEQGEFEARAWFGPGAEGPPGHVHGGALFAVLDEAMGAGAWAMGMKVFAARLEIHYEAMLPLDTAVLVPVSATRREGRKQWMSARLEVDGTVFTTAEGLFIQPSADKLASFGDLGLQPE